MPNRQLPTSLVLTGDERKLHRRGKEWKIEDLVVATCLVVATKKAGEGAEKQAASKEAKAKLCVIVPFLWQIKQHFWKGHQSFARSWSPAPVAAATGLLLKWGPSD